LDGLHLVQTYVQRVRTPELLLVSEHGLRQREIVEFLRERETNLVVLSDSLFGDISPVETPSGIAAVIALPAHATQRPMNGSCVVLDAVQDSGNVGSILRTAAAAGIGDVLLAQGCAQPWSPRVLRAGMGGHFFLRIHECVDPVKWLADYRGRILATGARNGRSLFEADLCGPIAWLFGAEGGGLSARLRRMAHDSIYIPMHSDLESLNVAAAAAICLFEARRRRLC